jgi:hypothetical protein
MLHNKCKIRHQGELLYLIALSLSLYRKKNRQHMRFVFSICFLCNLMTPQLFTVLRYSLNQRSVICDIVFLLFGLVGFTLPNVKLTKMPKQNHVSFVYWRKMLKSIYDSQEAYLVPNFVWLFFGLPTCVRKQSNSRSETWISYSQ